MAGYIHTDIKEIMDDAADPSTGTDGVKSSFPSTVGWSDEQLKTLNVLLQYSWNRGYKSACQDLAE